MTRQEDIETIETAINKALANGWMPEQLQTGSDEDKLRYIKKDILRSRLWLFDHDFAKALWGDEFIEWCVFCGYKTAEQCNWDAIYNDSHPEPSKYIQEAWQYHLQLMVIADDPIKYLQENIND